MKQPLVQFRVAHLLFGTAAIAAILAAAVACGTTYETHGAVKSIGIAMRLGAFVLASLALLVIRRLRFAVCIATIIVCGACSLHPARLVRRLQHLKTEVSYIVDYLNRFEEEHGGFPSDLSGYTFRRPELQQYVDYNVPWGPLHTIRFHPTEYDEHTGVSHWHHPVWGYYFEDD